MGILYAPLLFLSNALELIMSSLSRYALSEKAADLIKATYDKKRLRTTDL